MGLVCFGLAFLLVVTGKSTFPLDLLNPESYMIIVYDDYYSNAKLQQFVLWKAANGYSVQVKKYSELLSQYPVSNDPSVQFIKMRSVENMVSSMIQVYIAYWDTNAYYVAGGIHGDGSFVKGNTAPILSEIRLFSLLNGGGTIEITYDGGQKLTVTVPSDFPNMYTHWGNIRITTEGKLVWKKDACYSITNFLTAQSGLDYVLLVGNANQIPVFEISLFDLALQSFYTAGTDYIYSCRNFDSTNKNLFPSFSIGRFSVNSVANLETIITKTMSYMPHQSDKALFVQGNPGPVPKAQWDSVYQHMYGHVVSSLSGLFPTMTFTSLVDPLNLTESALYADIAEGEDFINMFVHGTIDVMSLTSASALTIGDVYSSIHSTKSSVMTPDSCSVNDFSRKTWNGECLGEAFLWDTDSQIPVFVGATLPTAVGYGVVSDFYYYLGTYKTVGRTLSMVKTYSAHIIDYWHVVESCMWNILGDPSLSPVPSTTSPPIRYGWLKLMYTIDGRGTIVPAMWSITFPNGTVLQYTSTSPLLVYNCPVGQYHIECTFNSELKALDRNVADSAETMITLAFYSEPEDSGTLTITSNVDAYLVVEAGGVQYGSTYGVDLTLLNLKLGTYLVTATPEDSDYGNTKSAYLTLSTNGQTVSYSFVFEVTRLPIDILAWMVYWAPIVLVGVGIFLLTMRTY